MKINVHNEDYLKNAKVLLLPICSEHMEHAFHNIPELVTAVKEQDFKGDKDQTLVLNSFAGFKKIICVGFGKCEKAQDTDLTKMGGKFASLTKGCSEEIALDLSSFKGKEDFLKKLTLNILVGFQLKSWEFTKYFTTKVEERKKQEITTINVIKAGNSDLSSEITHAHAIAEGVFLTRNLATEPANIIYSDTFMEEVQQLTKIGLEVEVLNQKKLTELGMGALLAVNQASEHEAKVGIIKWNGGGSEAPVAFVGKGVTFDSGGLSIKPAVGMMEMKRDMTGAATVVGIMNTLALRRAKVNAIGVVGLVENMVDSKAMRPGDVITSYSGKTIEVLNTDAEGRLVLADILNYTQKTYKPQCMIDLATLTGAIIIALGQSRAGVFSNDYGLMNKLMASGEASGDKLWGLPTTEEYREYLKSDIADICNISSPAGQAGSVTAAVFLKEFVEDACWAHIDIAGMAWLQKPTDLSPKGATGFGVRLLDHFVQSNYENKQ